MSDSILTSTKGVLGLAEDYTAFDPDITMYVNTCLSTLTQLGIGPTAGYAIIDKTATWETFLGASDPRLNMVQTYVYARVRSLFDPPATSYAIDALEKIIKEYEWRLNVVREGDSWTDPDPTPAPTTTDCF